MEKKEALQQQQFIMTPTAVVMHLVTQLLTKVLCGVEKTKTQNTHTDEREREIYGETGRGNNQLNNNTLIHQPVCMTASDRVKR